MIGKSLNYYYSETMNNWKEQLNELTDHVINNMNRFVGEKNDEITRSRVEEEMKRYLLAVREIAPIDFDLSKVGLCPITSTHDHLEFNAYTRSVLMDIGSNLAD